MRMSDWSSDVCSSDLARQRLPHDGIAGQALIARQVLPRRAQDDAQAVLDAQRAALPDRLVIRAHQRVQRAFVLQHRDLGDEGAGAVDALQLLGKHVLAAARSEESRVGKEGVSTVRSRWSPYH